MKRKLINSQLTNYKTFQMYLRQLTTLAENVFEFENLPSYIDISYLNKNLLRKGSVAFFYDEVLGLLALPYTSSGKKDLYGRPTSIIVMGENGYTRELKPGEFVIMYDNNARYSLMIDIIQFAERIGMCKRVTDINIAQQKTPRVWKTTTDKERTIRDLLNEYDGYVETVAVYDMDLNDLECVIAPAPYIADKVDTHLEKEWNEFLRLIGVANLTEQKRERLIKDEVATSQGGTIASRYSRFEPRKRAIEEINKKWGLNLEVKYYDGVPTTKEEFEEMEVEDNVSII